MTTQLKPRRRSQQDRSKETIERIVNAAFDVIRRRGYSGFRIAEVHDVAQVSRGAMLHHFPTKDLLVLAALEHTFAESRIQAEKSAKSIASASDPVEAIIRDGEAFFFGDHFMVALDILMSAGKDPTIRSQVTAIARKHRPPAEKAWLDVLLAANVPPHLAEDILWLTLSIVRGLAIRTFMQNEPQRFERLYELWRNMVRSHLKNVA